MRNTNWACVVTGGARAALFNHVREVEKTRKKPVLSVMFTLSACRADRNDGVFAPRLIVDIEEGADFVNKQVGSVGKRVAALCVDLDHIELAVRSHTGARTEVARLARLPLILSNSDSDRLLSRLLSGAHTPADLRTLWTLERRIFPNHRIQEKGTLRLLEIQDNCIAIVDSLIGTQALFEVANGSLLPRFPRTSEDVCWVIETALPSIGLPKVPRLLKAAQTIIKGASCEETNDLWLDSRRERTELSDGLALLDERMNQLIGPLSHVAMDDPYAYEATQHHTGVSRPITIDDWSCCVWDVTQQRAIPLFGVDELVLAKEPQAEEVDYLGFAF